MKPIKLTPGTENIDLPEIDEDVVSQANFLVKERQYDNVYRRTTYIISIGTEYVYIHNYVRNAVGGQWVNILKIKLETVRGILDAIKCQVKPIERKSNDKP